MHRGLRPNSNKEYTHSLVRSFNQRAPWGGGRGRGKCHRHRVPSGRCHASLRFIFHVLRVLFEHATNSVLRYLIAGGGGGLINGKHIRNTFCREARKNIANGAILACYFPARTAEPCNNPASVTLTATLSRTRTRKVRPNEFLRFCRFL